jgi:hypothetical protein
MNKKEAQQRIEELLAEIRSILLREKARNEGDCSSWSRNRDMPLEDILLCTLGKKGLSTTMEIGQYFEKMERKEQTVSKQAYLQQRQKLNPEVFTILNRNYLRRFYSGGEGCMWRGYLVMATDGSSGEIPNSKENRHSYGESESKNGKEVVARANISALHDVFNRFILDVGIHKNGSDEIAEAKAHISGLKEIIGDRPVLIMYDRNYASLEFMDFLEKAGVNYLIRLRSSDYKAERAGMKQADEEAELMCTKLRLNALKQKSPQRARELEEEGAIRVRIVETVFANGEKTALVTNLREGTSGDIRRLYRKRWSIEKKFHTLKNKMKFESVTGKASIYVRQDFLAQTLVFNIIQDLIMEAERGAVRKAKRKRYKYAVRINENIAIGLFKERFIRLMAADDGHLNDGLFRELIADMQDNIVPVRMELKSTPRKWNRANKYKCNLKPSF